MPNQKSSGLDLSLTIDFLFLYFTDTVISVQTEYHFNDLKYKMAAAAGW